MGIFNDLFGSDKKKNGFALGFFAYLNEIKQDEDGLDDEKDILKNENNELQNNDDNDDSNYEED